jgi:prepilin-type processing-associated H-X9-DG protein
VLVAEANPDSYADHIMGNYWAARRDAANEVDHERHDGLANYLFVDGHVEPLKLEETFDPAAKRNLWNPSLAE